ncbi:hypothetical protein OG447_06005 [Streptomyces sp. NBC_01408]|nr:hypothetical protein [Streptomyces sp. NBC_01408]
MLWEDFLHRLGELVCGGAGGRELAQESEHLSAQRVLDQGWLMGPVLAEGLEEPLGFGLDAALTASSF